MCAEYRYRLDADHLVAVLARYRKLRWTRRLLPIAGVVFIAASGYAFWQGQWVLGLASLLLGVVYLTVSRPIRWITRLVNRKSPYFDDDFVLRLGEEGIRATGTTSELHVTWAAVTEAWRFADGLLVFHGPRQLFWLPDSSAVGDARREAERLLDEQVAGGLREA